MVPAMMQRDEESSDGRVIRAQAMRERRRSHILEAAAEVFATKGYHEGSVADVIERAGVSRGTFYLYFDGKRAVLEAILEDLLHGLSAVIEPVDIRSPVPAYEQLRLNAERVLTTVLQKRALTRILFRHAEGVDQSADDRLEAFYVDVLELIGSSLTTGIELGIVRPLDVEVASRCVLGSFKEIMRHIVSTEPPDEKRVGPLAQALLEFNLRGLLAGG
jgi:AcrR family transcriptional regulator